MIRINENYLKLQSSYLFSEIAKKVQAFVQKHPERKVIRLGIGDVTRALPQACILAMHSAVDEMADEKTFRGYGPEQGYDFLREAIVRSDFQSREVDVRLDEIFVSDGSKCDTANIQEIFGNDIVIAIPDPVYPVYIDTNVMAGRTGTFSKNRYAKLVYLDSVETNDYVPEPPDFNVDLIYLCFPNNPTGATATKVQLTKWVDYATQAKAIILFDAAYVAYIRDSSLPQSIYEIEGARNVAIEFRSFSKTAGFTGTRCAYTVVPKGLVAYDSQGKAHELNSMWNRRHTTKFNGVSYPVQRAAEAVYSAQGATQVKEINDFYLGNASLILGKMRKLGFQCVGGENSPYIWIKTNSDSWTFFDQLLEKAAVVCTPGVGFGRCGEGYVRISAFNSRENVEEALERVASIFS